MSKTPTPKQFIESVYGDNSWKDYPPSKATVIEWLEAYGDQEREEGRKEITGLLNPETGKLTVMRKGEEVTQLYTAAELREAEEDAWEAGYDAARGVGGTRDDYFKRKEDDQNGEG